jgi:prevent-host-death family protein
MAIQSGNTVGAYAAKAHLSELLEKVAGGEEITITKHGTPVAKLVPVKRKSTPEERRAAIEAMRELAKGNKLRGLKIRDMINEGRR